MKQITRVRRLQKFLFDTGRMLPGSQWSRTIRAYPGPEYVKIQRTKGKNVKYYLLKFHPACVHCKGSGLIYVGYDDLNPVSTGHVSCPKCGGHMWSKKAYRFL